MDKNKFIKLIKDDPMAFAFVVDACYKLNDLLNKKGAEELQKDFDRVKCPVNAQVWYDTSKKIEKILKP